MRVLLLDIETAPHLVYTFDLWNTNVSADKIVTPSAMLCFSAKWLGEKKMMFHSDWTDGHGGMVRAAHDLLDQADAVMHYNGQKFDVPHLNREMLEHDLLPPSPFQQIDLWLAVKRRFKFASTKLDFVAQELGLNGKIKHEGFELWKLVMAGDEKAQRRMQKYCERDTKLLEELYDFLQPWIPAHPSRRLFDGSGCPVCGAPAASLQRRGYAHTKVSSFRQYQCQVCGSWVRDSRRESGVTTQESVL